MPNDRNKISNIHIEKFRKLKEIDIEIADRITVIAGHNGIGKSTLLGLIANGSELKGHRSYFDKIYQSQFQELFHLDHDSDYSNNPDKKYSVILEYDYSEETLYKKCTISKHGDRLKIVPRNSNEQGVLKNESVLDVGANAKVPMPTIYIGMSRVIPIGESDNELYSLSTSSNAHPDDIEFLNNSYRTIIGNEDMDNERISKQNLRYSTKRSMGPEYKDYPYQAVSLGQDSLSTIITAIISFKKLKRELDEDYKGGILVIDEVDACLHPAAQERLLSILDKASKELSLQIVVTSHSLTIIKEIMSKKIQTLQNPADDNLYYNVIYLQDTIKPEIMDNPTYLKIKNDMFLQFNRYQDNTMDFKVYFEDYEALFIYQSILKHLDIDRLNDVNLDLIEAQINCDTLLKLPEKDSYFQDVLIIPDGDVKTKERYNMYIDRHKNICPLPTNDSPEILIYKYLNELLQNTDHPYWKNNQQHLHAQLVRDRMIKEIDDNIERQNDKKVREYFKEWFLKYEDVFSKTDIISYWMNDNQDEIVNFELNFKIALDFLMHKSINNYD
ncbi:AAA family ATPase [Aquisalibacillus elongatus]|uniref:Putative AbiEii toxin of type IV toxin-antitoxin system n=1 Tax=Aquisalibacillus elongatus TaxID=485577 RepID=A0A3N5AZ12_9BACI|nr:AAA family ATPase [Aquisalibacillus elongatus]RPF50304.1 putative AbiEii toxin of type IV toxin-antitoxin system [Aquisalibacillus elongatus]